jgi:hypothetical protein
MPAIKRKRPPVRAQLSTGTPISGDPIISRHLSELGDAQEQQQGRLGDRKQVTASLVVGSNRVNHGLGRPARTCHVTPSVADASFSYALTSSDSRTATITVVGVAQPSCAVEFA